MAITKERLLELIEQEARIWGICHYINHSNIVCLDLSNERCKRLKNADSFEDLFETEEGANFALLYKNITRTETLSLPTWEEFIEKIYSGSFGIKEVFKDKNWRFGYKFQIDKNCYIFIDNKNNTIFMKSLTKDNYLSACEICRKLFLGEEVDNEM